MAWRNVDAGVAAQAAFAGGVGAPPAFTGAALARDPSFGSGGLDLLVGGCAGDGCGVLATWELVTELTAPATWVNVTTPADAPPAVRQASLIYDPAIPAFVLFGGVAANGTASNATWLFDVATAGWTDVSAQVCSLFCPTARSSASFVFAVDAADQVGVLFGGCVGGDCTAPTNDTWLLRDIVGSLYWLPGGSSNAPSPRYGAPLSSAGAADGNLTLLVGGCDAAACDLSDTWSFYAGGWLNQTPVPDPTVVPPARGESVLTYDDGAGLFLLAGGAGPDGTLVASTWALTGCGDVCNWTDVTDQTGVLPAIGAAFVENASGGVPLALGGTVDGTPSASLWVLEGAAALSAGAMGRAEPEVGEPVTVNLSTTAPLPWAGDRSFLFVTVTSPDATIAWQTTGNASVRFPSEGTWTVGALVLDRFDESWTGTFTFTVTNPVLQVNVSPAVTDVGQAVTVNGSSSLTFEAPVSYLLDFGDGTTTTNLSTSHAFAAPGTYTVRLTATDPFLTTTATAVVTVHPLPTVDAAATTPSSIAGAPVVFAATTVNGTGQFAYHWSFGDGGTADVPNATHTYAWAGIYAVTLTVSDGAGVEATSRFFLLVQNQTALAVTALAATSTTSVGTTVGFDAETLGGVPPYAYAWAFGDGARSKVVAPGHAFDAPGTYRAEVWANDSAGHSVVGQVTVVVTSPMLALGGFPVWGWGIVVIAFLVVIVVVAARPSRTAPVAPPPSEGPRDRTGTLSTDA